jgi:DNA-binding MarR family transcriptional regulator
MSNKSRQASDRAHLLDGESEPDPFTPAEFAAWRGMLRVHSRVMRELDRRLLQKHGLGIDAYGVLVTLVGGPGSQLTIGELGDRRNLSPSGISRAVDKLARAGLVERSTNPADARSLLVRLTSDGLVRLREAQVTHHATVRELMLGHLDKRDIETLGDLWEKAMPGSVSSPVWPPEPASGRQAAANNESHQIHQIPEHRRS